MPPEQPDQPPFHQLVARGAGARVGNVARFTIADGLARVRWFRTYLGTRGIEPLAGSPLARAFETSERVGTMNGPEGASPAGDRGEDHRDEFIEFVGIVELASAVAHVRAGRQNADELLGHLQLMATADEHAPAPEVTQTRTISVAAQGALVDPYANKIFELFVGCCAMRIGTDVRIDHVQPTAAEQGTNPDVLATIAGRRWGFACKALHSPHAEAMYANLEKAVDQIERSEAEVGVVMFSIRTQLDPAVIWPADGSWSSDEDVKGLLLEAKTKPEGALLRQLAAAGEAEGVSPPQRSRPRSQSRRRAASRTVAALAVEAQMTRLFAGKKALPGWAFDLHGTSQVLRGGADGMARPTVTSMRMINFSHPLPLSPSQERDAKKGLALFNDAVQRVYDPYDPVE